MRFSIAIAFLVSGCGLVGAPLTAETHQDFVYADPLAVPTAILGSEHITKWEFALSSDGTGTSSFGEIGDAVQTCSIETGFHCIRFPDRKGEREIRVFFAVPRRDLVVGETWVMEGHSFSVVDRRDQVYVLGRLARGFIVESALDLGVDLDDHETFVRRFLYSPTDGLLGFDIRAINGTRYGNSSMTYMLEGRCGFGCDEKCFSARD